MSTDELISKISNMYIMLLYAITKEDIKRVRHYLSEELYDRYQRIVEDNIAANVKQRYDEMNVASVSIDNNEGKLIEAILVVKYIDYKIDRNTQRCVSGDNLTRKSHVVRLTIVNNKEKSNQIYRCPNCGAGLNVNFTSVCNYCGTPLDNENSEYVIINID